MTSPYAGQWQPFRKARNRLWTVLALWCIGGWVAGAVLSAPPGLFSIVWTTGFVIVFFLLERQALHLACPRCGEIFSKSLHAEACIHCGLPKYAGRDPDEPSH